MFFVRMGSAGGMMRGRTIIAGVGAVVLALSVAPARTMELSEALAQLYASVSIHPPNAERMTVCYGFVCRRRYIFDFTPADRKKAGEILNSGRSSAEAERKAVQQAVVWFDRRIGPVIGTDARIAYADFRYFDDKHNFDCYDTTRNTTSLLLVLQEWGLLRHHFVTDPRYRGNFLVLQTPHNTAVLTERATGRNWVVDMWTKGYGELPDVMLLEKWMTEN
jgi:hypothetical protein